MSRLVSVVVPAYNAERHVGQAVDSVLGQTYGRFEVIVVDDGSTDGTAAAATASGDPRVRCIRTSNHGNYCARNTALEQARGDFVAFLDADDLWVSDKLERQVAALDREPPAESCFTDHYLFEGDDLSKRWIDPANTCTEAESGPRVFLRRLIQSNFLVTSSCLVRRSALERAGHFDTTYQNAMDYDLWLRLAARYRTAYLQQRLVLKRAHPGNISANRVRSHQAVEYTLKKFDRERAGTAYDAPDLGCLIRARLAKLNYDLGLEYLAAKEYESAAARLSSASGHRDLLRMAALVAARMRWAAAAEAAADYRRARRRSRLVPESRTDHGA